MELRRRVGQKLGLVWLFLWTCHLAAFPQTGAPLEAKKKAIGLAPSHIVIVQADGETIFGAYYFAVSNTTDKEQTFTSTLRLPRESIDFQAGEGLSNDHITILPNGVLSIRKTYAPGLSLLGVQFKVPVRHSGDNVLTFVPTEDVPLFFIASPQAGLLHFKAQGFEEGIPPMLAGSNYAGIRGQNIAAGQALVVSIDGFPGGRLPFLMLGAMMALLLLIGAVVLTLKTSKESQLASRGIYD